MNRKKIVAFIGLLGCTVVLAGCGKTGSELGVLRPSEHQVQGESTPAPIVQEEVAKNGVFYSVEFGSEAEKNEAERLIEQLRLAVASEENKTAIVTLLDSEEWYKVLGGSAVDGARTISVFENDAEVLTVQIGSDINGDFWTNLSTNEANNVILLVKQFGKSLQIVEAGAKDGYYDGSYEMWKLDAATGEILTESGTYTAGYPVGAYTTKTGKGDAADSVLALWNSRDTVGYAVQIDEYELPEELQEQPSEPAATEAPTATAKPTGGNTVVKPTPKPAGNGTATPPAPKPIEVVTPVVTPSNGGGNNNNTNPNPGNTNTGGNGGSSVTPTATPAGPTASPSATGDPAASAEPTSSPKPGEEQNPESSASPKPTETPDASASPSPSGSPDATATPAPSEKPDATATPTAKPEATATPAPTEKPDATATPTAKPEATATPAPEATAAPTATPEATQAPETTPAPTAEPGPSQSQEGEISAENL